MPKDKDFKRVVRRRASKTGESYTTARSQLLGSGQQVKPVRVAVSGAAGRVGYNVAFRLASGDTFTRPVELRLLELPDALRRAEAVAMELEDCSYPSLAGVEITDQPADAFDGADWVVLVGGPPRQPGMERADLLMHSAPMFAELGAAVASSADDSVRVLVVANPANTNCLAARIAAPEVPRDRWFALMRLDQSRARSRLAVQAQVPANAVSNVAIWGNHSATLYPDFQNAVIDGRPATLVIEDRAWLTDEFVPWVRQRGAQLLDVGGTSSAASAADAVAGCLRDLTATTPRGDCVAVAVVSSGEYSVPEGLQFGFPVAVAVDGTGWSVVDTFNSDAYARAQLAATIAELEQERALVESMLRSPR